MKNKKLEQLKTKQNGRRGIAIEMAILFLVVMVALSALLVSVSMMQIGKLDRANDEMEQRVVLDRIGEDFCRQRGVYTLSEELAEEYDIDNIGTTLRVYPKPREADSKPLLTVELIDNNDGTYTVTKWSYGE